MAMTEERRLELEAKYGKPTTLFADAQKKTQRQAEIDGLRSAWGLKKPVTSSGVKAKTTEPPGFFDRVGGFFAGGAKEIAGSLIAPFPGQHGEKLLEKGVKQVTESIAGTPEQPSMLGAAAERAVTGYQEGKVRGEKIASEVLENYEKGNFGQKLLAIAEMPFAVLSGTALPISGAIGGAVSPITEEVAKAEEIASTKTAEFIRAKLPADINKGIEDFQETWDQIEGFIPPAFKERLMGHIESVMLGISVAQTPGLLTSLKNLGTEVKPKVAPLIEKASELERAALKKTAEVVGKTVEKVKSKFAKDTEGQIQTLTGLITQGKIKEVAAAKRAFSDINPEGVKTYNDLTKTVNDKIAAQSSKLDEVLDLDKTLYTPDTATTVTKVGEKTVKQDFVSDALNDLSDFYEKSSPTDLARIQNLTEKYQTQGLTLKEINGVAKEYGMDFGDKAFSKTGEPLTNVSAKRFENIRKGTKETFRSKVKGDVPNTLDKSISDLILLRKLSKSMAEKVNALANRVVKRGFIEKVGRALGKTFDIVTFGGPKAFIQKLFFPSNVGLKTLNALDLQAMLQKNITRLSKLLEASDDAAIGAIKNAYQSSGLVEGSAKRSTKKR